MTLDALPHRKFKIGLHGYADGELNAHNTKAVEAHLDACPACRADLAGIRELKAALRALDCTEVIPEGLAAGIQVRLSKARARRLQLRATATSGLLAASLAMAIGLAQSPSAVDTVALNYGSAAAGDRPAALLSADTRRVGSWLKQRLGFTPPLPETAANCTIVGARIDHVQRNAASAVTYSCDGKRVVFYAVADRPPTAPLNLPRAIATHDMHVVTWQRGRLSCYAVSDLAEPRLLQFANAIVAHAA